MFRKTVNFVILLPLAIVLVLLSVANRQTASLALNPFRPEDPLLSLEAPFFVFLFVALMVGILIGSGATWIAQGKYRKRARTLREESMKWQTPGSQVTKPVSAARQIEA